MANDTNPALTFEVFRGGALIQRADFSEFSITIGRGAASLLRVDDPSLAELHAVINVEEDGSIALLDLGSDAGVLFKGERIANADLRSGDSFQVGDVTIVVRRPVANATFDEFDEDATYVAPAGGPPQNTARELPREETDERTEETPPPVSRTAAPAAAAAAAAHAVDHGHDDHDDHGDHHEDEDDIFDQILRSSNAGADTRKPPVLEVNQIWGNLLLDTKHFRRDQHGHDVTIGASVGYRWNFLGIDMGWVPGPARFLATWSSPMWSEVHSDWRSDFYTPDASLPDSSDYKLFRHELGDERYTALIAKDWDGFVDVEDKRYSFEELVQAGKAKKTSDGIEIPMDQGMRLMVDVHGITYYAHVVHPGARLVDKTSENVDYPFLAIGSFVAFLGVMFALVLWFSPKHSGNESVEIPDRFVELLLEKPEPEEKEKKKPDGNPDAGEGAKAKKEEGKVGKKDAKMEKAKGNKVEVKKQELDRQIAENAGVLGALRESGDLGGMFGSSGLDANLQGGIGGLIGAKGTQIGSGGLGGRGGGLGGGGTAEGLGGLGTKGMGSGASGYGSGGGHFGAKGEGGIGTVGGDPIILGALDRSLIDEVIKRHMNQIRYCYQRELTKNPALNGKIVIKFVIAKDGTVSSASVKTSTMGNAAVESCISGRFMRMQFPEPKGGGIVIVSYPFIFSPG